MNDLKRRLGILSISDYLIETNPDAMKLVFSKVIPVRAEHKWHIQAIEYLVMGECLDIVPEGERPPCYEVVIDSSDKNNLKISFEKVGYYFG